MIIDAVTAPLWLAVNAFLIWAGWRVGRLLLDDCDLPVRVCQVVLFWWCSIALAAVSLGALDLLTGRRLMVAGLVWGVLGIVVAKWAVRARMLPIIPSLLVAAVDT